MPQDRESGAKANAYGKRVAGKIAHLLGAKRVTLRSNEFMLNGEHITIRCAHSTTTDVGVLYTMLDRVSAVVAAIETERGVYQLYRLTPAVYREYMRDSKKKGRVGLVRTKMFKQTGKYLGTVTVDE